MAWLIVVICVVVVVLCAIGVVTIIQLRRKKKAHKGSNQRENRTNEERVIATAHLHNERELFTGKHATLPLLQTLQPQSISVLQVDKKWCRVRTESGVIGWIELLPQDVIVDDNGLNLAHPGPDSVRELGVDNTGNPPTPTSWIEEPEPHRNYDMGLLPTQPGPSCGHPAVYGDGPTTPIAICLNRGFDASDFYMEGSPRDQCTSRTHESSTGAGVSIIPDPELHDMAPTPPSPTPLPTSESGGEDPPLAFGKDVIDASPKRQTPRDTFIAPPFLLDEGSDSTVRITTINPQSPTDGAHNLNQEALVALSQTQPNPVTKTPKTSSNHVVLSWLADSGNAPPPSPIASESTISEGETTSSISDTGIFESRITPSPISNCNDNYNYQEVPQVNQILSTPSIPQFHGDDVVSRGASGIPPSATFPLPTRNNSNNYTSYVSSAVLRPSSPYIGGGYSATTPRSCTSTLFTVQPSSFGQSTTNNSPRSYMSYGSHTTATSMKSKLYGPSTLFVRYEKAFARVKHPETIAPNIVISVSAEPDPTSNIHRYPAAGSWDAKKLIPLYPAPVIPPGITHVVPSPPPPLTRQK